MPAADSLREAVLAELQKLVDPATFAAWHRNLQFVPLAADRFRIALPNEIYRQSVEKRLRPP